VSRNDNMAGNNTGRFTLVSTAHDVIETVKTWLPEATTYKLHDRWLQLLVAEIERLEHEKRVVEQALSRRQKFCDGLRSALETIASDINREPDNFHADVLQGIARRALQGADETPPPKAKGQSLAELALDRTRGSE
jgi:hypothetical protein